MNKGFITIPILLITLLGLTVVGGGGFGVYKYSQVVQEKQMMETELVAQKDKEIEDLKAQSALENIAEQIDSSDEIVMDVEVEEKVEPEPVVREVIRTVTEYVPIEVPAKPVIVAAEVEVEPEIIIKPIAEEVEIAAIADEDAKFVINTVRQTSFPDGYGGVYGGYEVEVAITAPLGTDVYVPQTTTNTIGASIIGFSYNVISESFSGLEDSKVSCSVRRDNNCKIKAGKTSVVTTTIWLYPDSESNGNYAVRFGDMAYYVNNELKTFSINRTTSKINLMY